MAQVQNPILTDMLNRLNTFKECSFGIDRRDSTAPLILCTNRQILPIDALRLTLWDQDGLSICDFRELPDGYSLIFDEGGKAPATCRLALLDKRKQALLALADDASPISGYLFVSVRPRNSEDHPWVISALFDGTHGCQMSSLLWHDDMELVRFLSIQVALLERGCPSNAQQLHPEAIFDDSEPFA